jgi:hypothetical protein
LDEFVFIFGDEGRTVAEGNDISQNVMQRWEIQLNVILVNKCAFMGKRSKRKERSDKKK